MFDASSLCSVILALVIYVSVKVSLHSRDIKNLYKRLKYLDRRVQNLESKIDLFINFRMSSSSCPRLCPIHQDNKDNVYVIEKI